MRGQKPLTRSFESYWLTVQAAEQLDELRPPAGKVAAMSQGELLARGRTSEVFAYGKDSAVKVLRSDVPAGWAELEAGYTAKVVELGLPAPAVRELTTIDGRPAIVFERIHGPSMWQQLVNGDRSAEDLARDLAAVHREIQSAGLPTDIPDLVTRISGKIEGAPLLSDGEKAEALEVVAGLPRGAALLHGDLHPANVLMGPHGPVVIDWFDASIGHPVADIVRSSILLRPAAGGGELPHLPGVDHPTLWRFHDAYVSALAEVLGRSSSSLAQWEATVAAGRLAEGAQPDESTLVALWAARADTSASAALVMALERSGSGQSVTS